MVHFTVDQMREIMSQPANVRNMTVIAHVDHGKSTLTDALVCKAGIISQERAGTARYTDTRQDEQDRCITIKSTGISLYHELKEDEMAILKEKKVDYVDHRFLINLIDSPGHVDFSSEVTSALRVTDGALVVVDCISGVSVQTRTVMKQALQECVKPVLFMNKFDRSFTEVGDSGEEAYRKFSNIKENINVIIAGLKSDHIMVAHEGDLTIKPETGNCGFGSGLHGWAFTLKQMAVHYHKKTQKNTVQWWMDKMWGDKFSNGKSWKTTKPDDTYVRGFVKFVFNPIHQLFQCCNDAYCRSLDLISAKDSPEDQERKKEQVAAFDRLIKAIGCKVTDDDKKSDSKILFKKLMQAWLPAGETLLELIILHLPSPVQSQKYRSTLLYEGPAEDTVCCDIRTCRVEGSLMMYISKMIPSSEKGRFLAYGRVFSGKVRAGEKVYVMGPNFKQGVSTGTTDRQMCVVQRVNLIMGRNVEAIEDVPCGNLCAITGVDKFLIKTGTITNCETACNMKQMKFSVSPVVRCAVSPKDGAQLPKLIEGLKKLAKSDPLVVVEAAKEGMGHVLGCAGELHLEIILKDLEEDYACIELLKSDPVVSYRETVGYQGIEDGEPFTVLSKSANKHNRLYCHAEVMPEDLCKDIDNGEKDACHNADFKKRAVYLGEKYGFDKGEAQKIWCYGPEGTNPNILLDGSKGVQYMNDIKDSVVSGFQWASKEGPLCDENMRGVVIKLKDATLHADAIHRGGNQIIGTARRAILGSVLGGGPHLVEPVFLVEITCPVEAQSGCYGCISQRRGMVTDDEAIEGTNDKLLKAYLPVSESFGFTAALRSQTGGQAFPQCSFDHWEVLNDNPLDPDSPSHKVVLATRKRKGLKEFPEPIDHYMDKL